MRLTPNCWLIWCTLSGTTIAGSLAKHTSRGDQSSRPRRSKPDLDTDLSKNRGKPDQSFVEVPVAGPGSNPCGGSLFGVDTLFDDDEVVVDVDPGDRQFGH